MPSLGEIGPVVLAREEVENVKSLQMDRRTGKRQTTGDQKSSLELSAQVS